MTEEDYNFAQAYNAYAEEYDVDHQTMAQIYLESMASTLQQIHMTDLKEDYDNLTSLLASDYPLGLSLDFYRRIAWEGLQDSEAFNFLIANDPEEYQKIIETVALEREHGGKKDSNICPR